MVAFGVIRASFEFVVDNVGVWRPVVEFSKFKTIEQVVVKDVYILAIRKFCNIES